MLGTTSMSSNLAAMILAMLVLLMTRAEANPRKFTSNDGKSLDAEMIELVNQGVTLRRTSDGMNFKLPLDRFSDADQA